TIITLGQGFHLQVVAEGVETLEQAHQLLALGCEEMQGYWFSRPLPEAEMTQLLGQGGDRRFCV
ncbi:MAG: EAL domain-containing protein, partial [Microcystaceae cyanobacterium]